jgi:hypothetical protein
MMMVLMVVIRRLREEHAERIWRIIEARFDIGNSSE